MKLFWVPFSLLLLGCSLFSCKSQDQTPVDGWEEAHKILTSNARNCHAGILALCLVDTDFINPILQKVLDQSFKGKMPKGRSGVQSVARRAKASYKSQQTTTEEARAKLVKKIISHYANPTITEEDNGVTVLLGPVPGKFEKHIKSGYRMVPSYWGTRKNWMIGDAAKTAREVTKRYPLAGVIRMKVYLPSKGGLEDMILKNGFLALVLNVCGYFLIYLPQHTSRTRSKIGIPSYRKREN